MSSSAESDHDGTLSYGRELWDCLAVLEKGTKQKSKQIENIKELFGSIKKGLENFSTHIAHSTQLYHSK